jgi:putative ABC transport system permease protein
VRFGLAVRLLFHDRGRLATALGGIAIAVLLMLVQLGFRNAIFDSTIQILDSFDADLIVQNANKRVSLSLEPIPRERLYQARAVAGVASAYPLWLSRANWKNRDNGKDFPVRVLAFRPEDPVWKLPEGKVAPGELAAPDTVLIDSRSRPQLGDLSTGPAQLARRSVRVLGQFAVGSDMLVDGNAIVGLQTFLRLSPQPKDRIEFVLIKAAPGVVPESLVAPLRAALPGDVAVRTWTANRDRDLAYWASSNPVGIVMVLGMFLGFLAGIGIVYQILYAQIADYLKEFATLRAIGWSGPSIISVVLVQALLLAVLGFIPSLAVGAEIYHLLAETSGLPIYISVGWSALVLALTTVMCLSAGVLAVRRLLDTDPADLFS